jgi:hypothetical protein
VSLRSRREHFLKDGEGTEKARVVLRGTADEDAELAVAVAGEAMRWRGRGFRARSPARGSAVDTTASLTR